MRPGSRHRPPYRTIWRFRGGSLLEFPPVVAYRRLFFANNSGVMWAISAETGLRAWKRATGRCVAASPAIAGRLVIQTFLNRHPCNQSGRGLDGEIVAYQVGSGNVVWQRRVGPSESSPLVANGLVYFGDWNGKVWALDAQTGAVRWTHQIDGEVKGGLALDGDTVYVGSYDHHVYAFDAHNGSAPLADRRPAPARLGRHLLLDSGRRLRTRLHRRDRRQGLLVRRHERRAALVVRDGRLRLRLAGGLARARLRRLLQRHVLLLRRGDGRGQVELPGERQHLGLGDRDGRRSSTSRRCSETTYGLDALTGRQVWSFPDGKYSPIVADPKRVYLVGYGSIYGMVDR